MAKKKDRRGNCPRCGRPMKVARRYCTNCGAPNAMLVPRPVRRRTAAKSAGGTYAPVVNLRPAVPPRDPAWTAALSDPDPGRRVDAIELIFKREA